MFTNSNEVSKVYDVMELREFQWQTGGQLPDPWPRDILLYTEIEGQGTSSFDCCL